MLLSRGRLSAAVALVTLATAAAAWAAVVDTTGGGVLLPTDRTVHPAGRITALQYFPTGAAVSPDGSTVVTVAGQPLAGAEGTAVVLDVIDAATGVVRQSLQVGDAFQSVLFSKDGTKVYVAGGADAVVHVFTVNPLGLLTKDTDLTVGGFVTAIALDPTGRWLWAAGSETARIARIDLTGATSQASVSAPNPAQLAISPDGTTLYAADWRGNTVTAVDTTTLATRRITVGAHPTGLAVLPDGTLVVTDADDATLATVAPRSTTAELTNLSQIGNRGDSPTSIALGPDGRLYVTLAADDAVAVLTRNGEEHWRVEGLIPTGWYPTAVTLSPDARTLYVVTAKGLGRSTAATAANLQPDPASLGVDAGYLTAGDLETLPVPGEQTLEAMTEQVRQSLRTVSGSDGSDVLNGGKIKHVIYITRENKTYDADLGDLHPGPGNALVLFGQTVTPNLHALERTFVESQNFTYPARASSAGHLWEDAGGTNDVFEKATANTSLSDDWRTPSNIPPTGLLVEQAMKAGLSVRTYNEELAQQSGLVPLRFQASTSLYPNYDLRVSDVVREKGWEQEFNQFEQGQCTGDLAAAYGANCSLPALEYVYLGEDHTTVVDEPGYPTIEAQVADNDYATARVIDAVSHSKDWASTLVVVVEDDPQGTGDEQSAYHGFIALASPWVRRAHISTVPYNLAGVVGAIDRVLGLPPLTDYVATSKPLDDLFTDKPDLAPFTADPSGVQLYPFTALPGVPPTADAAHGIWSFTQADATDPAITGPATWAQVKRKRG